MMKNWLRSHPLLAYYVMVVAVSWGSILMMAGPGGIISSSADPTVLTQFVYLAALAGPSIAGIVVTGLMRGSEGLRALLAGVLRWRVDARWYLVALLTAPLLMAAIVFLLSLAFPGFIPAIVTADDRVGLMISGIVLGLSASFFEEIGWTGFATAEFRRRHGILATGLILGTIWGAWHYPLFSGTASGAIPPSLYIAVLLFSFLIPFRILMVWVYERTKSVLVVMLMHAPLAAGQLIILPVAISNENAVIFDLAFAAALWVIVGTVYLALGDNERGTRPLPVETPRVRP